MTEQNTARRVVVAEDESLIRLDIVETLRDNGFDVVGEAGDGEEAVRLVEELRPDLVVMDVKMPKLDGISAAEQINASGNIAPVVLLTAFSQRELVERAAEAGALAYVAVSYTHLDVYKRQGRPSPITEVPRFAEHAGGARIFLKREDLNHTGSHKINNVLGQALLTKRLGKTRVIAETGAGQHGVATATAAALFGLECTIYMLSLIHI